MTEPVGGTVTGQRSTYDARRVSAFGRPLTWPRTDATGPAKETNREDRDRGANWSGRSSPTLSDEACNFGDMATQGLIATDLVEMRSDCRSNPDSVTACC